MITSIIVVRAVILREIEISAISGMPGVSHNKKHMSVRVRINQSRTINIFMMSAVLIFTGSFYHSCVE